MAIQTEVWTQDIQETLLPESDFMTKSVDHSDFVNDKTVHIIQAGTAATVEKDRSALPAVIAQRIDTDRTYSLAEYTIDPRLITNLEEIQTVPSKRDSIMKDIIDQIRKRMGDETANTWGGVGLESSTGQIVLATGTATANIFPPGGTGNRKAVLINDMATAAAKLDADDIAQENRWMLMPAKMYHNMLIENKAELLSAEFMNQGNLPSGVVRNIWGFNIMLRSNVTIYTNAATPVIRAVGSATATDDNFGAIGWHTNQVATALGAIKVFIQEEVPEFFGDILSGLVMHGSIALRTDGKGIVTIVQDT